MSTYEEMVVDRSVDTAWVTFRARLADHLVEMTEDAELILGVAAQGELRLVGLRFSRIDDESLGVHFIVPANRPLARRDQIVSRIESFGIERLRMTVDLSHVDEMCHTVSVILHEELEVVHPSFLTVRVGDFEPYEQEVRVAPAPIATPDTIRVASQHELTAWVDRIVREQIGHLPERAAGGFLPITRGRAHTWVKVDQREPVVEVWAHLGSGVDLGKAVMRLSSLSTHNPHHRFLLQDDRLYAVGTVAAAPFVPEHLIRMIDRSLELAAKLAPSLTRQLKPAVTPAEATKPASAEADNRRIDPGLMAMFAASRLNAAELEDLALTLSGGSVATLRRWTDFASRAYATSSREFELAETAASEELCAAHSAVLLRWYRLMRMLGALREALVDARDVAEETA